MPDVHYPDCVIESYREESGSLTATNARLRQENRDLRETVKELDFKLSHAENRLARLRYGGKG